MTTFVFRQKDRPHVFLTTEDPEYGYEWLCGCCEYPVELKDPCCPRCQRELENCPICSLDNHRRPIKSPPDAFGGRRCPTCGVLRLPFGQKKLAELRGSFCTNLFGCRAGGLLLATEHLAILPEGAKACPICTHPILLPLDIRTFHHHVNRCLFCSSVVDPHPGWRPVWRTDKTPRLETRGLGTDDEYPCPICGRNDALGEGKDEIAGPDGTVSKAKVSVFSGETGRRSKKDIDAALFSRMIELGQTMALEIDDARAADRLFEIWNDPRGDIPSKNYVTFVDLFEKFLASIEVEESRRLLVPRRERLLMIWRGFFREGAQYRIPL